MNSLQRNLIDYAAEGVMKAPSMLPSDNRRVPVAHHPFRHNMPVQIRFTDIDMLGHLNNNVYLTFMDLAKIEYFSALQGRPIQASEICMVVVNVNCDFLEPTYFTDHLRVWTSITHIGTRSVTLEQRIVDDRTSATKCIGRTVMAGFDPARAIGADIPQEWVRMVEAYEGLPLRTPQ